MVVAGEKPRNGAELVPLQITEDLNGTEVLLQRNNTFTVGILNFAGVGLELNRFTDMDGNPIGEPQAIGWDELTGENQSARLFLH